MILDLRFENKDLRFLNCKPPLVPPYEGGQY